MEKIDLRVYDIKPKETEYKGIVFKSRLEATWAVFFDGINVAWQYEPETFGLHEIEHYTPDFYLPEFQCYIEIKPSVPSITECKKVQLLSEALIPRKEVAGLFFDLPCRNHGRFYLMDTTDSGSGPGWWRCQFGETSKGLMLIIDDNSDRHFTTLGYDNLLRFSRTCETPLIDVVGAANYANFQFFERKGR